MTTPDRAVETFSYHRSVAQMLWVLVGIAAVELAVTHLLIAALVSTTLALVLSALTAAAIAWLVLATAAMRRLPVELDADRLIMRAGWIKRLDVPLAAIVGLETEFGSATIKDATTLNLALIAYPNVVLVIDPPSRHRNRTIRRLAHRLDDPAAFIASVERLIAAR